MSILKELIAGFEEDLKEVEGQIEMAEIIGADTKYLEGQCQTLKEVIYEMSECL